MHYHKKPQRAFILILALFVLSLISEGIITLMIINIHQTQSQSDFMAHRYSEHAVENCLNHVEHQMDHLNHCVIPSSQQNDWFNRDADLWQSRVVCLYQIQNHSIQYIIESLGDEFYRITAKDQVPWRTVIQITLRRQPKTRRYSWRILDS